MHANVHINLVKDGEVIDSRRGHNVWVDDGRSYLANLSTFTSPINGTTEGSVDLVADYPTANMAGTTTLIVRLGHVDSTITYTIILTGPANSAALLVALNSQVAGMAFSLGGSNGLVLTPDNPVPVEILAGSAMLILGLLPEYVAPAGYTTTPIENRRVKYMGFGIGGVDQGHASAYLAPLVTAYQPGQDPNATTGDTYQKEFPTSPVITSLERPVRVSGTLDPYPGDPADVWLVQDPKFANYVVTPGIMKFHATVTGTDIVYPPLTEVPLSEVGLFLSDSDVNDAYNAGKLVAYYSFATLLLTPGVDLEMVWTVSF